MRPLQQLRQLCNIHGDTPRFVAGTSRSVLHSGIVKFVLVRPQFGLARMDRYRLFVYNDDGRPLGAAIVIHAADDAEAIAQAEGMRGSFPAELLDVEGLRIVKYLNGRTPSLISRWQANLYPWLRSS